MCYWKGKVIKVCHTGLASVRACISLEKQQGPRCCSMPGRTCVPVQVEAPLTAMPQVKLWPLGGAAMAVFWRHTPPKKLLPCSSIHNKVATCPNGRIIQSAPPAVCCWTGCI